MNVNFDPRWYEYEKQEKQANKKKSNNEACLFFKRLKTFDMLSIDKITLSFPLRLINLRSLSRLSDKYHLRVFKIKSPRILIFFNAELLTNSNNLQNTIRSHLCELYRAEFFNSNAIFAAVGQIPSENEALSFIEASLNIVELEIAFDTSIDSLSMPEFPQIMRHPFPTTWYSRDIYLQKDKSGNFIGIKSKSTISIYRRDIALIAKNKTAHSKIKPLYRLEFRIHDQKFPSLCWNTLNGDKIAITSSLWNYMVNCGSRLLDPEIIINDSLVEHNYLLYCLLIQTEYRKVELFYDFLNDALSINRCEQM